jgi:hypothetical protein
VTFTQFLFPAEAQTGSMVIVRALATVERDLVAGRCTLEVRTAGEGGGGGAGTFTAKGFR